MPYIKNKLAAKISINSPTSFKESIIKLGRDGIDPLELNAIRGTRRKAEIRSYSRLITEKERMNMKRIANIKI